MLYKCVFRMICSIGFYKRSQKNSILIHHFSMTKWGKQVDRVWIPLTLNINRVTRLFSFFLLQFGLSNSSNWPAKQKNEHSVLKKKLSELQKLLKQIDFGAQPPHVAVVAFSLRLLVIFLWTLNLPAVKFSSVQTGLRRTVHQRLWKTWFFVFWVSIKDKDGHSGS